MLTQTYFSGNELPRTVAQKTENGSPIKFYGNEVIENPTKSENIERKRIFQRCTVIKARENESLAELLQNRKIDSMAYICRYKLVRDKQGYRLEAVDWQLGEDDQRALESDFDDQNAYTDTDSQSEAVLDLNATLDQIHLNLTNDDVEQPSPHKNLDYRANRTQSNKAKSDNKRSSPDASLGNQDVSPSKRNKLNDAYECRETLDSPEIRSGNYLLSPAVDKMKKIRKNLNRSIGFADTSMDVDSDVPGSPYVIDKLDNPMKMTLRKESKRESKKTPLKERNDNTVSSHELEKTVEMPFNVAQREISKVTQRTRSK